MRRSFSLIEVTMVVLIIGMLSAMVIPRISKAGGRAGGTVLLRDLQLVREALLLYAVEHGNTFPGPNAGDVTSQLTQFTSRDGAVSTTLGGSYRYGPYLVSVPTIPVGPNAGSNSIMIDETGSSPPKAKPTSGDAWVYNPVTGEFYANLLDASVLKDLTATMSGKHLVQTIVPRLEVVGGNLVSIDG